MVTLGERSLVRIPVGVLEFLGTVQVDLHCAVLWQHQDLRNARARVSRLSTLCGRVLGDLYPDAIILAAKSAKNFDG